MKKLTSDGQEMGKSITKRCGLGGCGRPAVYRCVCDGILLCDECAPRYKANIGDKFHKMVRPHDKLTDGI